MKILVTGGAGFLGSHIAEAYIEQGHEVTVIDNLSVGERSWVPDEAEFEELDIEDAASLREFISSQQPDIINHHAAHNDAMSSLDKPQKDARTNIVGSINILEAARETDVEKIIYASSGGLSYGEPQQLPTPETHGMKPSYPYGISKHSTEHYLELYQQLYGIDFTVLRYGSVYGPRATGGVIKNFLEAVKDSEKPVIFGDGSQTRDFIHVDDIAASNILALRKGGNETFNIGSETENSINQLWDIVSDVTGYDEKPVYRERWLGDIDRCRLDCSKARDKLGWKPETELRNGIRRVWKNYYSPDT